MTPDAINIIKAAGYADPDGKLHRRDMAAAILPMLNDPTRVVHGSDEEERSEKGLSLDEIAHGLFGHTDSELRALVGQLTSPSGAVQNALADGVVLCPWKVERPLGTGEATSMRKVSARFVTDNPDAVNETIFESGAKRAISAAVKLAERHEMASKRIPALASYLPALARRVNGEVQLALPVEAA